MKVVIDLTALADNYSGMEHYAESIITELLINENKLEKKIKYLLVFKNELYKSFAELVELPMVDYVILHGKNKLIFNQLVLLRFLLKIKADKYLFPAFPPPLLFRKRKIYSVVFDMVCWDCPETMKTTAKYYFRMGIAHAVKVSKNIITISEFSKKRIEYKFTQGKEKIKIVYCGVEKQYLEVMEKQYEEKLKIQIQKKYSLPNRYILCLSTIEPRKNMKLLIDVFAKLVSDKKIDYQLVIVGRKGWKVEQLMEGVCQEAMEQIVFTGFVDAEDLPIIYSEAECFVFPSVYEGFGMPPLEALACGTAVISSDIEVAKEVLGDCVCYFENNSKLSLEEKLLQLQRITEQNQIRKKEIEKQIYKYSWTNEAKKVRDILVD